MKNSRSYEMSDGAEETPLRVVDNNDTSRKGSGASSPLHVIGVQENHHVKVVKVKQRRNCTGRRTGLEKVLLVIVIALFAALAAAIIIFVTVFSSKGEMCTSPACIHAASHILKKLNLSADPCQDFYSYTCGGFLSNSVVPDDELIKSTLQQIQEEVYTIVKKLIENPIFPDDKSSINKAKKLYHSCLSENWTAEDDGRNVAVSFLDSVELGEWPILTEPWSESNWKLEKALAILTIYQVQPFIDTFVSTDDKNTTVYILQLYRGGPALERDFYLNDSHPLYAKYMSHYSKLMMDTVKIMGVPEDVARTQIQDVLSFEKKLANLTHSKWHKSDFNDTNDDDNYNKMSVAELQLQIPEIEWSYMLDYVFENLNFEFDVLSLPLILHNKNYLHDLVNLLSGTPQRVIANYLLWRFVLKYMPHLNQRFSRLYSEFRRNVPDPNESTRTYFSRWKECVAIVNEGFGMILGSLYANTYFTDAMEVEIHQLVNDLKSAFVDILPNQDWLDDETKEACKEKLWRMGEKIGYPKFILDPKALEDEYDGLEIQDGHLLSNILRIKRFELQKELKKLQRPVNKDKDWYGSPLDVNAFYRPNFNEIVFPAGILRFPFYGPGLPSYLRFGSIGVVIGHEITHGFDNYGRKYDKNGNHSQWWSDDAIERFNKEAMCFAEQYAGYKMDLIDEHVNGNDTLGDNICDNAGLKHAYVALQKWKKVNGAPPKLPGINFSDDQMFFIQYGQIWCEVVSKEGYIKYTKDPHSPGKFRTIGALSNSPEFAKTFQCPLGTPMNPEKKCNLWV